MSKADLARSLGISRGALYYKPKRQTKDVLLRDDILTALIDTFTREIIEWQIGLYHTTALVLDVLEEAIRKRNCTPTIFHSDQGSEYASSMCIEWLVAHHINPSHSGKGKPWHNGRQESFFNSFKFKFGKTSCYATIESLIEAIGKYIHYYNTSRIHGVLKTPPREFFVKEMRFIGTAAISTS